MYRHHITDWDDAYSNGIHIPKGDQWPDAWVRPAAEFRAELGARAVLDQSYGPHVRHVFDLFLPEGEQRGVVVFVHGGFWMRLDKSFWSNLAAGSLAHGFAVAMPSYRLAPEARISEIVADIGLAITAIAARVDGPIHLTGHSAGGHLVTRMISSGSPLAPAVAGRIGNVVSISGLHDLRPLMKTGMNATLRIDLAEALAESPALLEPVNNARLTCWVGAAERAEFRRQNALLANIWVGLGATTEAVEEPDRHHFNIVDGLAGPDHPMVRALVG
jgi:acetyl esterase/lipase